MSYLHSIFIFLMIFFFTPGCNRNGKEQKNTEGRKDKPNFIIIFTDDQGYGDLGCYGNETLRTPHIDQLAENGIRFTDFYVAAAVCTPSRAALLTGCYPQRVGLPTVIFPNDMPRGQKNGMAIGLNPDEMTLAELLQKNGYATACIGKWHLGDLPDFMPLNHGFDEYFGLPYSNDMMPGATSHDFDPIPLFDGKNVVEMNPNQDFLTKRYTHRAIDFIRRNQDNPFFLYLAHSMPHRPCHASKEFAEKWFSGEKLATVQGEVKETRDFLYPATIEELDWSVGEIVNTLRQLGIDSNTLVVFTSDNGPAVGSAGPLRGRKGSMYEGGVRVPCIMYWKGKISAGRVCRQIITSMDLFPTFANMVDVSLAENRKIDGIDMTSLILGEPQASPRDHFFYLDQGRGLKAVRQGKWKLFPGENPQLYDLQSDVGEQQNLAAKYPERVRSLTKKADEFENDLTQNQREPGLIPVK